MPRRLPLAPPPERRPLAPGWARARALVLIGAVAVVVALVLRPEITLDLVWSGVVPLLPATFLLSPALWRSVCPLATVGMGRADLEPPTRPRWLVSGAAAIALLVLAIPARHLVLNQNAQALAALLVFLLAVAWMLGRRNPLRSGFCNSFCPVLPVERLYGQAPVLSLGNPRCPTCTGCSPLGCVDLSPAKSIHHVIGPARRSSSWILTPFGAFAAAFPGVVFAYFLTPDGTPADAVTVYGAPLAGAAASWGIVAAGVATFRWRAATAVPVLAAVAIGVYYWFAIEAPASLLGLGEPSAAVRAIPLLPITLWATTTVRGRRGGPSATRPLSTP